MDKQIMDLSSSLSNNDFINLHDDQHHITGGVKGENHPVRPIESFPNYNIDWIQVDGARAWNSADTKTNTVIAPLYLFYMLMYVYTCISISINRFNLSI